MKEPSVMISVHRTCQFVVDKDGDLWVIDPTTKTKILIAANAWTARFAIECLQRIAIHVAERP